MAPTPMQVPSEATLYLDLKVNGEMVGSVVPVRQTGTELHVRRSDLQTAGVSVPAVDDAPSEWMSLDRTPGVEYRYDSSMLQLEIIVPPHWFAEQRLAERRGELPPAVSDAGFALNYAAYLVDGDDRPTIGSLWSELRWFNPTGVLTSTGLYRYATEQRNWTESVIGRRGYVRLDTTWSSSNEDKLHRWTIGDLITGAQSWSTPVRLAGVQLARDFRLRPDVITYPLPEFSGQAALPSTVDLFINGQRVRSEELRPGPYTITSVPYLTGAGEATIVTTDALGRQVVATLPFYASTELLRAGFTDYSVSFGLMRRDYGVESFSYGRFASTGSLRYGVTNTVTLEGHTELAPTAESSFGSLGVGAVMKLGLLGVVSGAITHSSYDGRNGSQWSFGYRYTNGGVNFGYQTIRRTDGFYSLAYVDTEGGYAVASRSDVLSLGLTSRRMGSTAFSYIRVQSEDEEPARFLNMSYVRPLSDTLSLHIGASRDLERNENRVTAQVLASFGRRGNVTISTQRDPRARNQLRYNRSIPSHGGIGWNIGHASTEHGRSTTDASVAWSNRFMRVETGIAADSEENVGWADLRGSLLFMDRGLFASRQVSDAFVVVSTDGISGVPVRYENQLVGLTNRRGQLLVPWVSSHYPGKFSIDPMHLPPEIALAETDRRLVVKRNSGAVLEFDVRSTVSVLIKLVDRDGIVVPVGSVAQDRRSGETSTVGYDGLVYFTNLESRIELQVRLPDGGTCRAEQERPTGETGFVRLGPLVCEAVVP
jgi:outer membrane usher protein